VQTFTGNYARYLEKKQEQEERQATEAQKLKQMARRELEWLRRGAKARTRKAQARIDNALDTIHKSREAAAIIADKKTLELTFESSRLGGKILTLENISHAFGDNAVIRDFSYQFKRGDCIGVIGANGAGKTTLLEIIAGRLQPDAGQIEKGQTVVIGYYDQESRELPEELRLIDYVKEVAERIQTVEGDWITASQMLERFLFPPQMQYQPIGTLSGGERRRLYLLRLLMSAPNVLLLDEITNDLDIATLVALEEYLESFAGCLVVVSHDRYFLDRTVDSIFRFENGRIREYPGNYAAFLEIRERERLEAAEQTASVKVVKPPPQVVESTTGKRKLSFKEKREFAELETRIAVQEARKTAAEAELAANGRDHVLVAQLYEELQLLNETLDRDMERWAELAEFAE
jgi:ATP-binding cassette subfamily F protein uup